MGGGALSADSGATSLRSVYSWIDLRDHSSPGASASPPRPKSSQDPSRNALALKPIHQLELHISSTKSAYEDANKIAQKARSAKAEAEHQVRRLSEERNDLLADKDERIKCMNLLSDAHTVALERVRDLEGQVTRATESLRDAQDENWNFADIKRMYESQLRGTKAKVCRF
jgi:chromosome segregation ATPase